MSQAVARQKRGDVSLNRNRSIEIAQSLLTAHWRIQGAGVEAPYPLIQYPGGVIWLSSPKGSIIDIFPFWQQWNTQFSARSKLLWSQSRSKLRWLAPLLLTTRKRASAKTNLIAYLFTNTGRAGAKAGGKENNEMMYPFFLFPDRKTIRLCERIYRIFRICYRLSISMLFTSIKL